MQSASNSAGDDCCYSINSRETVLYKGVLDHMVLRKTQKLRQHRGLAWETNLDGEWHGLQLHRTEVGLSSNDLELKASGEPMLQ